MKRIHYLILLGFISLSACTKKVWQVTDEDTSYYRFDNRLEKEDQTVDDMIEPYRSELSAEMNAVIGELGMDMSKRLPESTLGNFVATLLEDQAEYMTGKEIDFSLQNHGGIRINSLAKGPLTRSKIYELMPFDNMLVLLKADGRIVKQLFDVIAKKGGWPMTDGIRLTIKDTIVHELLIHGEPVQNDKEYSFIINDYIANGGDNCFFLSKAQRSDLGITVRDAILQYIERNKGKAFTSELTGRVKLSE